MAANTIAGQGAYRLTSATRKSARQRIAELTGTSALMLILAVNPLAAQQIIGANSTEIVDGNDPTGSGSGTRPSPWIINDNLVVGAEDDDNASLVIRNGGVTSNGVGAIGGGPGADGAVTVTGPGSTWTNSELLIVGLEGNGALTIEDGAAVSNTTGAIGHHVGSSGAVTVTGVGSTWTNSNDLFVGVEGSGVLTIEDGAAVNNADGSIGYFSGSSGSVTVTGTGSAWSNSGNLYVGDSGAGALTVSDGGAVSSTLGFISNDSSATGEVTVTGANSAWTISDYLSIGEVGAGTLTISDGGSVTNRFAYIGYASDARGTVTVTGAGSSWTNSARVFVGNFGTGTLTVENGATVSAGAVTIAEDQDAVGTVHIEGNAADGRGVLETGHIERGNGDAGLVFDGGVLRATGDEADFLDGFDAGEVTIDTGGAFIDTAGYGIGIAVDLQGDGGLTKQGNGTLTLSGSNSYAGTTTVEAGTLQAGAGGAFVQNGSYAVNGGTLDLGGFDLTMSELLGSGGVVAIGEATLTLDQASNTSFGGSLSGTGAFVVVGSGRLLLTGDSSGYAGMTTVSGGHMIVNGSLGGVVEITGGILSGSGSTGALTIGAGVTVAPGNSIGTLTVAGDLIFDAGATYAVEADPDGSASDLIDVAGTAFLNGASVLHVGLDGEYKPLSAYTILSADGGISGTFGAVTSAYAFLTPDLSYDMNNVYLEFVRNDADFSDLARTHNQTATAEAAENLGAGHAVYNAIVALSDDDALIQSGFDALSGEIHASTKTVLITESRIVRDAASERLRAAFDGLGAAPASLRAFWPDASEQIGGAAADGLVPWGVAFGGSSETDTDGNAAALGHNIGGLLAGADAMLGDWRLGLLAGYSRADFDVDDRASTGSSDNYHLGFYGGTQWGNLAFRSGVAHTWHDIETGRSVAVGSLGDSLQADYWAGTLQAFGELGYQIDMSAASFEPFANLVHVRHRTDAFMEQGGAAALASHSSTTTTTFTTLGLRAETGIRIGEASATLRGATGWQHASGDTTPRSLHAFAGGEVFTIAGAPVARNAFILDAGFDFGLAAGATVGLSYAAQIGDGAQRHGARALLSLKF